MWINWRQQERLFWSTFEYILIKFYLCSGLIKGKKWQWLWCKWQTRRSEHTNHSVWQFCASFWVYWTWFLSCGVAYKALYHTRLTLSGYACPECMERSLCWARPCETSQHHSPDPPTVPWFGAKSRAGSGTFVITHLAAGQMERYRLAGGIANGMEFWV